MGEAHERDQEGSRRGVLTGSHPKPWEPEGAFFWGVPDQASQMLGLSSFVCAFDVSYLPESEAQANPNFGGFQHVKIMDVSTQECKSHIL